MIAGVIDRRKMGRLWRAVRARDFALLHDRVICRMLPPGNPVIYVDRFVMLGLSGGAALPGVPAGLEVGDATPADLDQLCARFPDRADLFRRRRERGQRCVAVKDAGRVVAREWVIPDAARYLTNGGMPFVPLARPARWCHDIFVDPEYRGRRLFQAMTAYVLGSEPDGPHLYCEVHYLNGASLRAHERLGFRRLDQVTVVGLLGLRLFVSDDGRVRGRYALHVERN